MSVVTLLLGVFPAFLTAQAAVEEYILQEEFEGDSLDESWAAYTGTAGNGNSISVSGGELEIVHANGAETPYIAREFVPAAGQVIFEIAGRPGAGTDRAQEFVVLTDAQGREAIKFRWFGAALQARTAKTVNAGGSSDYAEVARASGGTNAAVRVMVNTLDRTVTVYGADPAIPVIENHPYYSSGCEAITTVKVYGTSRFAGSAATGSVYLDYARVYTSYESVAAKDVFNLSLGDISKIEEDFTLPQTGEGGSTFTWSSSDESVIRIEGDMAIVTRQAADTPVVLTVTAVYEGLSAAKDFQVTVVKSLGYHYFIKENLAQGTMPNGFRGGADTEFTDNGNGKSCIFTKSGITIDMPQPENGIIYLTARLKIMESTTFSIFTQDAGDPMVMFNFKSDGRMELRVDGTDKRRVEYQKGVWFDVKIRMDMVQYNCDVWFDDVLKTNQWPFIYEKVGYDLGRIELVTDMNGMYLDSFSVYRDSNFAVNTDSSRLTVQSEAVEAFNLPIVGTYCSEISWESNRPDVIEIPPVTETNLVDGFLTVNVTRQVEDVPVILTAEIREDTVIQTKEFAVRVLHEFSDDEAVRYVADTLYLGDLDNIMTNLFLTDEGDYGTSVTWKSDNPAVLSDTGQLTRSYTENEQVNLTATVTKNGASAVRVFAITVPAVYTPIEDPDIFTDEAFFGVWNGSTWTVAPMLNYAYNSQMEQVGEYVKAGDIEAAKQAFLAYYRDRINKNTIPVTELSTARDINLVNLTIDQIWNYSQREKYLNTFAVSGEKQTYSIDITAGFNEKRPSSYMLMSRYKGGNIASFDSKESGNSPVLELMVNGSKRILPAVGDTYIRAGSYYKRNYSTEPALQVRDTGAPVDEDNMRAYIKFDISSIKDTDDVTSARIVVTGSTNSPTGSQDIIVFNAGRQIWDEETLTWNSIKHMTYSFYGVPGGYDFSPQPDQDEQWSAWTSRSYWVDPMINEYRFTKNEYYAYHAISQMITQGKYDYGNPQAVISYLIDSQFMTPEAFTALMKMAQRAGHKEYYESKLRIDNLGIRSAEFARFFPELMANEDWWGKVTENINYLLNDENGLVYPDNTYLEGSNHYVIHVINNLFAVRQAYEEAGREVPEALKRDIPRLVEYFFNATDPNLQMSEWGDTSLLGGHMVKSTFEKWYKEMKDLDIRENLRYVTTSGEDGEKPDYTSRFYPAGDIGIFRTSWDSDAVFSFINNRTGGFHAHPDALAMTVYGYGRRLITDTGVASYDDNDPIAYWQKNLTRSQNSIEINDIPQTLSFLNEKAAQPPSESRMIINDGFDMFTGWNDANVQGTNIYRHTRNVLFVRPSFFIVSDHVSAPPSTGVNKYNMTWHMHPTAKISYDENTKIAKSNFAGGANIYVVPADPEKLDGKLDDGYGYAIESKYLSYVQETAGDITYDTVLFPYQEGQNIVPKIDRIAMEVGTTTATALKLTIDNDISYYYYSHEDTPVLRKFGDFETDARMVYVEMNKNGDIASISIADGSVLNYKGETVFEAEQPVGDLKIEIGSETLFLSSESEKDSTEIPAIFKGGNAVKSVQLNGSNILFSQNGDYIRFSQNSGDVPVETDPETGNRFLTAPQMDITVPYSYQYTDYSIRVTIPEGTVITGGSGWDGTVFSPAAVPPGNSGSFSMNTQSGPLTFDSPVKIVVTQHAGVSVTVPDGKTAALGTNSFEAAAEVLVNGITHAVSRNGSDLVIYALNSDTILIGKVLQQIGTGGGGGSSGGSSPGGTSPGGTSGGSGTGEIPAQQPPAAFGDIENHWARKEIQELYEQGIVNGISNAQFAPDSSITRAEFIAMVVRALGLSAKDYQGAFVDVRQSDWFASVIQTAADSGLINGSGDGMASPNALISRQEMTKIIMAAYHLKNGAYEDSTETLEQFTDKADIAAWAIQPVAAAKALGIVSGMTEDTFAPLANSTRAQGAVMIRRMLSLFGETKGE